LTARPGKKTGLRGIFLSSLKQSKLQAALAIPLAVSPFYLSFWIFYRFGFKKKLTAYYIF